MANIENELSQMRTAVYGEDMRKAIYDAMRKINDDVKDGIVKENQNVSDAGKALVIGSDGKVTTGKTIRCDETQSFLPSEKEVARNNIGAVASNYGSENAGKALVVGSDGGVTLGEVGVPETVAAALLSCFAHVAWTDEHGQNYYDALYNALHTDSETWDFVWDYSMGLPQNNGMSIVEGATDYTVTLTDEGVRMALQDTSASILRYTWLMEAVPYNSAVLEVVFSVVRWGSYNVYNYMNGVRINCGFGNRGGVYLPGAQLTFNQSGISVYSPEHDPAFYVLEPTPIELNTDYRVRIEQRNTSTDGHKEAQSDIYVNGRFIATITSAGENIGASQMIVKRGATALFKSFKMRVSE